MSDIITVTGNIATDPEHRRTPAGIAITTFRVASGQRRYDRAAARWIDAGTNWYSVSTYRGLAEHAFHSLRKGDRVVLSGRLRVRQWESGGKQGTAVEIDADAIGHDLLWGTSTFTKDASASAAPGSHESWTSQSAPAAEADWTPGIAAEAVWSAPGADSSVDPERAPELVGANAPY